MNYYYPEGMPRHLSYPPVTVPQFLTSAVHLYGDRVAVADGEESFTYTQLLSHVKAMAAFLQEKGVGPGSTVGLHLPNTLHFYVAYYGALFTGATVTAINPLQPVSGLVTQVSDAGAHVVISHPAHVERVVEAIPRLDAHTVIITPASWSGPASDEEIAQAEKLSSDPLYTLAEEIYRRPAEDFEPTKVSPDSVAHLAYTGGTTGKSKGVQVLHRNLVANVCQVSAWRLHSTLDFDGEFIHLNAIPGMPPPLAEPGVGVTVQVPPLFHAQGLITSNMFIIGGITIVLSGRFKPEVFVEIAQKWEATYVSGNPPMYLALAQYCIPHGITLPTMRMAVSGAAPLDSNALDRIAKIMPNAVVGEGYGMTEATCHAMSTPAFLDRSVPVGTVGVPGPDTEVEVRSPDGLTVLGDGEEGELWIRGPQVTAGYANAPEKTAEQFVDGWLRTGDIASRDERGFFRIHDRAKDMIIYKGYNVYPRELEDVASKHPGVAKIAVVGKPDAEAGEIPVAFVIRSEGSELSERELIDFVAADVLPYQKIRHVHFATELPTSAAGKILKTELRDRL